MRDQFGRKIDYMRISVTDLCNLRCIYCMPESGITRIPHAEILRFDEIVRICRIASGLGITRIKLTGGEPLVRRGVEELIWMIAQTEGIREVTLTTNGILLKEKLPELVKAGISAVNISLDTMDAVRFQTITRRNLFSQVMEGIQAAAECSRIRTKINCVAMPEMNREEWVRLAGLAKTYPVDVRFIEMMPIGQGRNYPGSRQEDVQKKLEAVYGPSRKLEGEAAKRGNGPAVYWEFKGFCGKIGFISAVSHRFCKDCNRIRMTAEGFLKPCLQFSGGVDLKTMLRNGADDRNISAALEQAVYGKPSGHQFTETENMQKDARWEELEEKAMFHIGG